MEFYTVSLGIKYKNENTEVFLPNKKAFKTYREASIHLIENEGLEVFPSIFFDEYVLRFKKMDVDGNIHFGYINKHELK